MKFLLYYLLQVMIASGILYSYYHFALRNNKFHRYNRFYLLAASVISIVIPFFNIPVYFSEAETQSSFVLQTLTTISPEATVTYSTTEIPEVQSNWFTWQNLSYLFYILVAFIVLLRILFSLYKIRRIIKSNTVEAIDNIQFINTDEPSTPFSFFKWLFWNKKIELNSEKGEQIFRHELYHIKQKHSWDIMYLEILTVFFWINPFFHLIKKETKAIHEFLADQFAVTENRKWEYAELLLMQILNTNQQLVNPFFNNQIKRRIAMITTSKKPSYQYARKLMVLPVAAIVIGLFAFSYKEKQKEKKEAELKTLQAIADTTRPTSPDNKVYDKVDIEASFPGGESGWRKYLEQNADATIQSENKAPNGQYTVVIQFIVNTDGSISDIKPLTKHGYGMEKEAIRVIKKAPKWNSAIINGKVVKAYKKQPLSFEITKENSKSNSHSEIIFFGSHNENKSISTAGIVVIDGVIQEGMKASEIDKKVSINDIESFSVLTAPAYKYGDKGKHGAIEIITKKIKSNKYPEITIGEPIKPEAIFTKVEIEPSFPEGEEAFKNYITKNQKKHVIKIKEGSFNGTIQSMAMEVTFLVDVDGTVSDVKQIGYDVIGMGDDAVDLIKKGPKWNPAIQNGHKVKAYKKQRVTFYPEVEFTKENTQAESLITLPSPSRSIKKK